MIEIAVSLADDDHKLLVESGISAAALCSRAIHDTVTNLSSLVSPIVVESTGLTPRMREVVRLAELEARESGSSFCTSVHLLRAILEEGQGIAASVLLGQRVTLKYEVPLDSPNNRIPASSLRTAEGMSYSVEAENVFRHAAGHADWAGQRYLGTEHLLLGMTSTECRAASTLSALGIETAGFPGDIDASLASLRQDSKILERSTPVTVAEIQALADHFLAQYGIDISVLAAEQMIRVFSQYDASFAVEHQSSDDELLRVQVSGQEIREAIS